MPKHYRTAVLHPMFQFPPDQLAHACTVAVSFGQQLDAVPGERVVDLAPYFLAYMPVPSRSP